LAGLAGTSRFAIVAAAVTANTSWRSVQGGERPEVYRLCIGGGSGGSGGRIPQTLFDTFEHEAPLAEQPLGILKYCMALCIVCI